MVILALQQEGRRRLRADMITNIRITVLPGRDHDILNAYKNQELYAWFLKHVRMLK
jgi:hypothetical protein